jgi:hypothetical protein
VKETQDDSAKDVVDDIRRRLASAEQDDASQSERETKMEIAKNLAEATTARNAVLRIRSALAEGAIEGSRSWEFLHELHTHDIELKAAIERSWRRSEEARLSNEAGHERLDLSEALDAVEHAIDDVRDAVLREQNPEEAAQYDTELEKAQAAWHEGLAKAKEIKSALEDDALAPKDRSQAIRFFTEKAVDAEQVIEKAYEPLPKRFRNGERVREIPSIEMTAAFEAAARAEAEFHETIHGLLIAEFEQGDREPSKPGDIRSRFMPGIPDVPVWEGVTRTVRGVRALIAKEGMSDALKTELLADLKDREEALSRELEKSRGTEGATVSETTNRIAAAMHLIEDARHELQNAISASPQEAAPHHPQVALDAWTMEQHARIEEITREQEKLVKRIRDTYGEDPRMLAAKGWSLKRLGIQLLNDRTGALDKWRALDREREKIQRELEPALQGRGERGEAEARANATKTDQERLPTERDFFGGSLEESMNAPEIESNVKDVDSEVISNIVASAESMGVPNAEHIYANILTNPAVELLSFDPEDYVQQLVRIKDARENLKKPEWMNSFMAKRRLRAAREVLREMQKELRGFGMDPKTGEMMSEEAKTKKKRKKGASE